MPQASSFFSPGGPLADAHPDYEHRQGQTRMAEAVERVLEDGGALLVEAGTGTGKTLAYLVPAIASGKRVIVSTGTRNLQDQIFEQDLPFLRERLGLDFSACLLKGRDNYLCRYRLAQFVREPLLQDLGELPWLDRIKAWAETTRRGDRAEIADLPDSLKLWRDVNARADTCTGARCPEYENCWLTRIKREAQQAQIVVVNHYLFFADLALRSAFGAVLPDYDTVIFDEAHLLEEIATTYFGVQASAWQVEELAREAERVAAITGGTPRGGGGAADLRAAADDLFMIFRERLRDRAGRQRLDPPERRGPDVEAEWAALSEALDGVARESPGGQDAAESLPARSEELRLAFASVLARDDPNYVYGMELRGRANVVLSAAPIDVSGVLRERLFEPLRAAVLTSATLTVEGSFGFFLPRLGLDDAESLVVDSPFDHERQAVLYLPSDMPEPQDPGFIDAAVKRIVSLLEITSGRAFLLFTSYANLSRAHMALSELGRWPLLSQGEGSKVALVERFKVTPGAVLLGTTSFWHGVDVPGDALSLVVIDKLPFAVPSDPLVAARIERIRDSGGRPFDEYQVPLAVLELKQGLGRLLRRSSDRGVLAVLDPRLTRRRYGQSFLASLPPYRRVDEVGECARFFNGE